MEYASIYDREHIEKKLGIEDKEHTIEYPLQELFQNEIISEKIYRDILHFIRQKSHDQKQKAIRQKQEFDQMMTDFKRKKFHDIYIYKDIKTANDVAEFADQIVAIQTHSYYFGATMEWIAYNNEQEKILFEKISKNPIRF